jgi:hypothetical protein
LKAPKHFTVPLLAYLLIVNAAHAQPSPQAQTAPGAPNASWNAGRDDKGTVAFWLRNKEGACEEQKTVLPLVFAPKGIKAGASSGPLQVKELSYCFLYLKDAKDEKDLEGATSNCASGSVELAYDAAANEYRGKSTSR